MIDTETRCPCGKPLHYGDPEFEKIVTEMVADLGENIVVSVGRRKWSVPRHFIALHGLQAALLPEMGFPEVTA